MTSQSVHNDALAACRTHGAKVVSDAAYAAMSGQPVRLQALGLGRYVGNLPALHLITTAAYELMSDDDQALDLAQASIDAAKLP
ncbi:MAG: hypothetical protein ACK6DW_06475 [Betaproteobacteria bacterium]